MFTRVTFWPWFAGVAILVAGLARAWPAIRAAKGVEKLIALGPVLYAAPLAAFGAEHFALPRAIFAILPAWMPARMFWVYFVGTGLIFAGLSIALKIYWHLAAALVGIMFVLFVAMIHIPNVTTAPGDRFSWAVALRDTSFAGAGFALAATRIKPLRTVARILVGVPLVFFAVEHILHPQFAPGVPLEKMTPEWFPLRPLWGYLTGAVMVAAGVLMLLDAASQRARTMVAALGGVIVAFVVVMYVPLLPAAAPTAVMDEINAVFDTLLFGGAVLLAAGILGTGQR